MADGTTFQIDIQTQSDSVVRGAEALARMTDKLIGAEFAAKQAAAAVESAKEALRGAEKASDRTAVALEKATEKVREQQAEWKRLAEAGDLKGAEKAKGKLDRLIAGQDKARVAAEQAAAAVKKEAAALEQLESKSAKAADHHDKLKNSFGNNNFQKIGNELQGLGGPLGSLASKIFGTVDAFGDLKEGMGSGGLYAGIAVGIVAVATSIATVTASAIAGVAAITSWAVGLSDAARTQRLFASATVGSDNAARRLEATIFSMGTQFPQTKEELMQMADTLAKTGLKGDALTKALKDTATKAAVLKFGPDFEKQTLSLNNQSVRLKENISRIFSGLRIEKLLEGFAKLVELFDTTQVTGRTIKTLFESLFQPIIDGVVSFIPKMVSAFIQFEILVMKAMIAIKPFGSTIMEVGKTFLYLAGIVAVMSVGFVAAVITPFVIVIGLAAAAVALFIELGSAFLGAASAAISFGSGIVTSVQAALTWLSGLSLAEIGTAMIDGLVNGITSAGPKVLESITGLAKGAVTAAKNALGIKSPSTVFAEIGVQTAAGMEGGVDEKSSDVQQSLEAMVAPPAVQPAAPGAASPSKGEAGPGGAGLTINVYANGNDAQSIVEALERFVAQGGLAVANA